MFYSDATGTNSARHQKREFRLRAGVEEKQAGCPGEKYAVKAGSQQGIMIVVERLTF